MSVDPTGEQDPRTVVRRNPRGQVLCTARKRGTDELCRHVAAPGQRVCKFHGGASPQAKNKARMRLAELVAPAIVTLAREMAQADKSSDRLAAANSILDRAGWARVQRMETTDARDLLLERLVEMREQQPASQEAQEALQQIMEIDHVAEEQK